MKRLIRPLAFVAALGGIALPASAQSKDLSGSWTLDVEKSGTKDGPALLVLALNDKELTARAGNPKAPLLVFKLDGTETVLNEVKTRGAWNGNKLDATVINSEGTAETVSFSRDGAWLLMEAKSSQHGPMKLYFKKTPDKL